MLFSAELTTTVLYPAGILHVTLNFILKIYLKHPFVSRELKCTREIRKCLYLEESYISIRTTFKDRTQ